MQKIIFGTHLSEQSALFIYDDKIISTEHTYIDNKPATIVKTTD
jgi:hypothetical protein